MNDLDRNLFHLNSIVEVNDRYYILNGWPTNFRNEDLYYEIHIKSDSQHIRLFKSYIGDNIFVDLISKETLEVYYEKFYERFSDRAFSYTSYSYTRTKKTSKKEWKPKVKKIQKAIIDLLDIRLKSYVITRNKVVENYKLIYKEVLSDNKFKLDEPGNRLFNQLYSLYYNTPSTSDLDSLANPNKKTVFNDWRLHYENLETIYNNLSEIDLDDYSVIKDHVLNTYIRTFDYILANLKLQFKYIEEDNYKNIFYLTINTLRQTSS